MDPTGDSRWGSSRHVQRGADYDRRWAELEAAGRSIHGEADFIAAYTPSSVLDAGCGTGRVAIELARRGVDVVGLDLDPAMLAAAREKAPELTWIESDLCDMRLGRRFDVVATVGNVMIFLRPGSECSVVANLASHLGPDGRLVAGFQLNTSYTLERYDADCRDAGLELAERFATWERAPYDGGDYAVSVHRPVRV